MSIPFLPSVAGLRRVWRPAARLIGLVPKPLVITSQSHTLSEPVYSHPFEMRFNNAVRLAVLQRPRAKRVRLELALHCGSTQDALGREGTAHFLEHILVRSLQQAEEPWIFHLKGSTGKSGMHYEIDVPTARWKEGLAKLRTIFDPPSISASAVAIEAQIIRREIEEDDRYRGGRARFQRKLNALVERKKDGRLTIGTSESVAAMTPRDLLDYHQRHFPKARLDIRVIGAVDAKAVSAEVAELFAAHRGVRQEAALPTEAAPAKKAGRVLSVQVIEDPSRLSHVLIDIPLHAYQPHKIAALQAMILHLSQRAIPEALKSVGEQAHSSGWISEGGVRFNVDGDASPQVLLRAVIEAVNHLQDAPLELQTVERLVRHLAAEQVPTSVEEELEWISNHRASDWQIELPDCSPQRIHAAAWDLHLRHAAVLIVVPKGRYPREAMKPLVKEAFALISERPERSDAPPADPYKSPEPTPVRHVLPKVPYIVNSASSEGGVRHLTLENGLRLVLDPHSEGPDCVSMSAIVDGAIAAEPAHKAGLSFVLASALLSRMQGLQKPFWDFGWGVGGGALGGPLVFHFNALTAHALEGVERFATGFYQLPIDEAVIGGVKRLMRISMLDTFNHPYRATAAAAMQALYGSHRMGLPVDGTQATLDGIDLSDVLAWRGTFLHPHRVAVGVSGIFDPDVMAHTLTTAFAQWDPPAAPRVSADPWQGTPRDVEIRADLAGVYIGMVRERAAHHPLENMAGRVVEGIMQRRLHRMFCEQGLGYFSQPFSGSTAGQGMSYSADLFGMLADGLTPARRFLTQAQEEITRSMTRTEFDKIKAAIPESSGGSSLGPQSRSMMLAVNTLWGWGDISEAEMRERAQGVTLADLHREHTALLSRPHATALLY